MEELMKGMRIILFVILLSASILFIECNKKNPCDEVYVSSSGNAGLSNCSGGGSASISGIRYDRYGRRTSYSFTLTCTSSGDTYSGSVTLSYNNLGQVTSSTLTVKTRKSI